MAANSSAGLGAISILILRTTEFSACDLVTNCHLASVIEIYYLENGNWDLSIDIFKHRIFMINPKQPGIPKSLSRLHNFASLREPFSDSRLQVFHFLTGESSFAQKRV